MLDLTFFSATVLTLIGVIVVYGTGAVVPVVKAVEVGSTYRGETVSFLVIVEVFTAASLGLHFLRSAKNNG